MESIIFLVCIIGAVAGLFWFMNRSSSKNSIDLAEKQYKPEPLRSSAAENMVTPGNNILARKDEIWEKRRKKAHNLSQAKGDSHGHIKFTGEREYDGYSRRDRQHLNPAKVQEEAHIDDLTMTSIKFEPDSPAEKVQTKS